MTMHPGDQRSQLIGWYEKVLGFTNSAATALYKVQMINSLSAKSVLAGEKLVATYSVST